MDSPPRHPHVASCVNLSVANLDQAQAWYCEKLGFRMRVRRQYSAMNLEIAFLERDGFEVELIQFAGSQPAPAYPDPPQHAKVRGATHFGIGVPDLERACADLLAADVPILFGPKTFEDVGIRVAFFRDPEGNLLKYVERLA